MEHIDPEILKRLDALAAKLGVGASHLWSILVRQAYVTAYMGFGLSVLLTLVAGACLGYIFWGVKTRTRSVKKWQHEPAIEEEYAIFTDRNDAYGVAGFLLGMVAVASFVTIFVQLWMSFSALLNPEFFALQQILSTLGK